MTQHLIVIGCGMILGALMSGAYYFGYIRGADRAFKESLKELARRR